jgi:DNA helicase-2/ATP-dependent DNA helicase PcrA
MAENDIDILHGLSVTQLEAVNHLDGPLLIVAGPGSGKTRVISHRIARLVRVNGVHPHNICAVTFTNRAARELRSRMDQQLGVGLSDMSVGTFHSLCARILRIEGTQIGIPMDFVIMDGDDQLALIKRAMLASGIDPKRITPRAIISSISWAKSQLLEPDAYLIQRNGYYGELVYKVFVEYEGLLARSHGLDFDDLLSKTVRLLHDQPDTRIRYQERFVHFMVDEFQDTNTAQYQLARTLSGKHHNLCVVGDPDQSIYSWRNADLRNILSFQKDYPDAKVVNLAQNYRSTNTILSAARHLIAGNVNRLNQSLYTENDDGAPVTIYQANSEEEEASFVLNEIERLQVENQMTFGDFVVTFRVNAQSRAMEEACLRKGVPYKLIGGVRFYHRREIKDILGYLRLIQDPFDEASLLRIINVPARGIGKRTVDELISRSNQLGIPIFSYLQILNDEEPRSGDYNNFSARQTRLLVDFLQQIVELRERRASEVSGVHEFIDLILERIGYAAALVESDVADLADRLDNIRELRGMASEASGVPIMESLQLFLEHVALISDQDALSHGDEAAVTLITLHQIKGLEYPVVFMLGLEEGLLPHMRSLEDPDQLEEERRLAYVGMTRAKDRLYLLHSLRRRMSGAVQNNLPSRFLNEIPNDLITRSNDRGRFQRTATFDAGQLRHNVSDDESGYNPPLAAGDKVLHTQFGEGIVVSCTPSSGDFEVTVAFVGFVVEPGSSGVKRLLYSVANLAKIEGNA